MKNFKIVRPNGLKGQDKINRMKELMGESINRTTKNSVVELTKLGPDNNVYAIVREGHTYFIKKTENKKNIIAEDFEYMGGLQNKTSKAYESYSKALKQLNLKFISLCETYEVSKNDYNVFLDDNLVIEHHPYSADQKLSPTKGMGDGAEYVVNKKGEKLSYDVKKGKESGQFGDNVAEKDVDDEFEDVKLTETEMVIENMLHFDDDMENKTSNNDAYGKAFDSMEGEEESKKGKFSISKAINEMDSILDSLYEEDKKELRSVKVTFDNGDSLTTSMAAHLSDEDIKKYYATGKSFNLGNGDKDKMAKVSNVEILKENVKKKI